MIVSKSCFVILPSSPLPITGEGQGERSVCFLLFNHDLLAVHDEDTLLGLLHALAGQVVDNLVAGLAFEAFDACGLAVAEVQNEILDADAACGVNGKVATISIHVNVAGHLVQCAVAYDVSVSVICGGEHNGAERTNEGNG